MEHKLITGKTVRADDAADINYLLLAFQRWAKNAYGISRMEALAMFYAGDENTLAEYFGLHDARFQAVEGFIKLRDNDVPDLTGYLSRSEINR